MLAPKRKPPRSFKTKQYPPGGIPGVSDYPEMNRSPSQEADHNNAGNNNVVIERIGRKSSVSLYDGVFPDPFTVN